MRYKKRNIASAGGCAIAVGVVLAAKIVGTYTQMVELLLFVTVSVAAAIITILVIEIHRCYRSKDSELSFLSKHNSITCNKSYTNKNRK